MLSLRGEPDDYEGAFATALSERAEAIIVFQCYLNLSDFSVVLFRPHFMLASAGYPMKVHNNQRLLILPSPLNLPYGATN